MWYSDKVQIENNVFDPPPATHRQTCDNLLELLQSRGARDTGDARLVLDRPRDAHLGDAVKLEILCDLLQRPHFGVRVGEGVRNGGAARGVGVVVAANGRRVGCHLRVAHGVGRGNQDALAVLGIL